MKITDENVIKNGEKELINTIIGDLDWSAIKKEFKGKYSINIQDDVEYRQGDIVVYDNNVAYRLNFDVKMSLSILFDRTGDYLSLNPSADTVEESQQVDVIKSEGYYNEIQQPEEMNQGNEKPEKSGIIELTDVAENPVIAKQLDVTPSPNPKLEPAENISQMASELDYMLSEINESRPE
jgi:hypothetical protein